MKVARPDACGQISRPRSSQLLIAHLDVAVDHPKAVDAGLRACTGDARDQGRAVGEGDKTPQQASKHRPSSRRHTAAPLAFKKLFAPHDCMNNNKDMNNPNESSNNNTPARPASAVLQRAAWRGLRRYWAGLHAFAACQTRTGWALRVIECALLRSMVTSACSHADQHAKTILRMYVGVHQDFVT